jgi:TRAP-type C4-dicarboxylate transport system substrate-binding protein
MRFIVVVLLVILMTLPAVGCTPGEADHAIKDGETIELTLAHFQPATHGVEMTLIKGWAKALEEATEGRLKIKSFPGETLLPGTEIYEGVVDGVADIGHSAYSYTRGRFPVIETFLTPGLLYHNAKVADWVAMEGIEMLAAEELRDVKHLFSFSTGRGDMMMRIPVRNLEDLSGVEVGVTSGQRAEAFRLLGATGVVFTMPEHYEAISRGFTQGVIGPIEVLKSFRIAEVTDYVIETPFLYNQLLFMVMNLEKWNSLPTDIQEIIEEVTEQYYQKVVAGFYDHLNENVLGWLDEQERQIVFIKLSEQEMEKWIALLEPLKKEHKAYLDDKGLPGAKILDTVQKLTEKYNELYGNEW